MEAGTTGRFRAQQINFSWWVNDLHLVIHKRNNQNVPLTACQRSEVLLVAHLHVVHAHQISAVVQVLFEVAVLSRQAAVLRGHGVFEMRCWAFCQSTHKILKDQCEAAFCVDDVVQGHDVGVFQVLQQWHWGHRKHRGIKCQDCRLDRCKCVYKYSLMVGLPSGEKGKKVR